MEISLKNSVLVIVPVKLTVHIFPRNHESHLFQAKVNWNGKPFAVKTNGKMKNEILVLSICTSMSDKAVACLQRPRNLHNSNIAHAQLAFDYTLPQTSKCRCKIFSQFDVYKNSELFSTRCYPFIWRRKTGMLNIFYISCGSLTWG